MCADEKFGQATAEANRPTHFLGRSRSRTERRGSLVLSHAEGDPADKPHAASVPCILGGRSFRACLRALVFVRARFQPRRKRRAGARYLSRRLTRAKSSPFVCCHGVAQGGTVNRPCTHVTYRKQNSGHHQGRNFPVQLLSQFSAHISRALRAFLPGTVTRVETRLTRTKQTIDHTSTRNVPAHTSARISSWQLEEARRKSSCARNLPLCYSVDVPPRGTRATAPARPSQQWRPSPAHFFRSAGTSCQRPLPGRIARGRRGATGRHTCAL